MKKITIFLAAFIVLASFTVLNTSWKNDAPHSQLAFTVKHLGINKITGYVHDFQVNIQSVKPDFSDAVVTMIAKTASINTRVDARDNHLKSADFFEAEKYPEITFTSTSIKPDGKNEYKLTGNLTMHGVTRQVTLEMEHKGTIQNPQSNKPVSGIQIKGSLKRSDFGIGSKFSDAVISDKVEIRGEGEFVQN